MTRISKYNQFMVFIIFLYAIKTKCHFSISGNIRTANVLSKCLDVQNKTPLPTDQGIELHDCSGSDAQAFTLDFVSENIYNIKAAHDLCMGVKESPITNTYLVRLEICNGRKGQQWNLKVLGFNYFYFQTVHSLPLPKCLTIVNDSTGNNNIIQVLDCTKKILTAQSWSIAVPVVTGKLYAGIETSTLHLYQCMYSSNGKYRLCLESNGNLINYQGMNKTLVSTGPSETVYCIMEFYRNFVCYNSFDNHIFSSNTDSDEFSTQYYLSLNDDGNIAIYNHDDEAVSPQTDILHSNRLSALFLNNNSHKKYDRLIFQSNSSISKFSTDTVIYEKRISFIDGPLYVYSNVSAYEQNNLPISSYLFTIQLSPLDLPSDKIIVTPVVVSIEPSVAPTKIPTTIPTLMASKVPSALPILLPSYNLTIAPTYIPSIVPIFEPSSVPSINSSMSPFISKPSVTPTSAQPSLTPNYSPSNPTMMPTETPSSVPIFTHSYVPSIVSNFLPSVAPSFVPSYAPSIIPTYSPSKVPTFIPSVGPSVTPSFVPSYAPSVTPTYTPSSSPTVVPSVAPSVTPSFVPSYAPSVTPTYSPSSIPTFGPSVAPSVTPSFVPSYAPSVTPTYTPSSSPTFVPSVGPSVTPSFVPSYTPSVTPTYSPSKAPTFEPSIAPSVAPSFVPSYTPSVTPTYSPSKAPTFEPSIAPSVTPSFVPSYTPSVTPTYSPSKAPTFGPSVAPSVTPSFVPSYAPSVTPTYTPSSSPTFVPSIGPSVTPSFVPSYTPSVTPTYSPSKAPTFGPSVAPSVTPSFVPSYTPSVTPTYSPSKAPTFGPSVAPSVTPSFVPSYTPSVTPTYSPSKAPTFEPSIAPSVTPSFVPSYTPSVTPTYSPSKAPTFGPSVAPSVTPSFVPSYTPSVTPTYSPSSIPTFEPSIAPSVTPSFVPSYTPSVTPTYSPTKPPTCVPSATYFPTQVPTFIPSVAPSVTPTYSPSSVPTFGPSIAPSVIPSFVPSYAPSVTPTYSPSKAPTFIPSVTPSFAPSFTPSFAPMKVPSSAPMYLPSITPSLTPTCVPSFTPTYYLQQSLIQSNPSSLTFLHNYSDNQLTTSFYLDAPSNLQGSFNIQLYISGPSAAEYTSTPIFYPITILPISGPILPPRLLSARFNDVGSDFIILFDIATDLAQMKATYWNCSNLFDFIQSSVTACSWVNSSAVIAILPQNSTIVPGMHITIHIGKLRAQCTSLSELTCNLNNATDVTTVTLLPAYHPVIPVVVIYTSSSVAVCDKIILDTSASSGSGGRPFTSIIWTVYQDGSISYNITNFLNTFMKLQGINEPIIIPKSYTVGANYTFQLNLTNFMLQTAQSSVFVTVSQNIYKPSVKMLSPSKVIIRTGDILTIMASARPSSCIAQKVKFNYIWSIRLTNNPISLSITSISKDRSQYILPAYTLNTNKTYIIKLTVQSISTSSFAILGQTIIQIYVYIRRSPLAAIIKGGADLHPPIDRLFILDATRSRDYELPATTINSNLKIAWTCSITSFANFGALCNFPQVYSNSVDIKAVAFQSSTPIIFIPANTLSLKDSYIFTCYVFSDDGRQSSTSVVVKASLPGSVTLSIHSAPLYALETEKFAVIGQIDYDKNDIVATWSISLFGDEYPISTATKLQQQFSKTDVETGIRYPISPQLYSLLGGRTYQFRLTAYPVGLINLKSYTEINIKVIRSPRNGYIAATPSFGYALQTIFLFNSIGWIDDPDSLPLLFTFSYLLSDNGTEITVGSLSPITNVLSTLPAGLTSNNNTIIIKGSVYNTFQASAMSKTIIHVHVNKSAISVATYLSTTIEAATLYSDSSLALQAIGNSAITVNKIICPPISNCSYVNRNPCIQTPYTCGSCFSNYSGIAGDSNVPCYNPTITKSIGENCIGDNDCQLQRCVDGICVTPLKTCVSASINQTCTGHGVCSIFNISSNDILTNVTECRLNDQFCYVKCICHAGFGGADCSFTLQELISQSEIRTNICQGITYVGNSQNPSSFLASTLSNTLYQAYNPSEVITQYGVSTCVNTLSNVSELVKEGYVTPSLTSAYFSSISNFLYIKTFVNLSNASNTSYVNLINTNESYSVFNIIDESVTQFQNGYFKTIFAGFEPLQILKSNLRISFYYNLKSSSRSNTILSPPQSNMDIGLGVIQPTISLSLKAYEVCGWSKSIQMSAAEIPQNAFSTQDIVSSAFRFGSTLNNKLVTFKNTSFPVYFITLQYQQKLSLNLTEISLGLYNKIKINYTIPLCQIYNKYSQKYIPCQYCNVSTISNYNITYACYSNLICTNSMNFKGKSMQVSLDGKTRYNDDDIINANDDGTESTTTTDTSAIFSNLMTELSSEVVDVLSTNPASFNIASGWPILVVTGVLFLCLLCGSIYFKNWDLQDNKLIHEEVHDKNNTINFEEAFINSSMLSSSIPNSVSFTPHSNNSISNSSKKYLADDTHFSQKSELTNSQLDALKNSTKYKTSYKSELRKAKAVNEFMSAVIPIHVYEEQSTFKRYWKALLTQHRYIRVLAEPSLVDTRLLRWLSVCRVIFFAIFIDTLFFQICFPDASNCYTYTNKSTCLAATSPIASVCIWDNKILKCSANEPPENMFFTVLVSMICVLFIVPIDVIFDFISDEIVSKRPDLSKMKLFSNYWLTELPQMKPLSNSSYELSNYMNGPNIDEVDDDSLPRFSGTVDINISNNNNNNSNARSADDHDDITRNPSDNLLINQLSNLNILRGMNSFSQDQERMEFPSIDEEVDYLIEKVNEFMKQQSFCKSNPSNDLRNDEEKKKDHEKVFAILHEMHVKVDGTYSPPNIYNRIVYSNQRKFLTSILKKELLFAIKVKQRCLTAKGTNQYYQDIALIHSFIEDDLSPMKRFIFTKYLANDNINVGSIHPIYWLIGWIFYISSLLFCIYWTFVWGLNSGGHRLKPWANIFWISVVQDLAAIEIFNIYLYYILGIDYMRNQMFDIYNTLKMVLYRVVREGPGYHHSYVRVCQHLIGACRAAHSKELWDLSGSKLLRELDDDDVAIINQTHQKNKTAVYVFLGLPAYISSITCDYFSGLLQACVPPLLVGGFLIFNAVIAEISIYAIVILYSIVVFLLFYLFFIYYPAKKRMSMSKSTGSQYISKALYVFDHMVLLMTYDGIKSLCYYADNNVRNNNNNDDIQSNPSYENDNKINSFNTKLRQNLKNSLSSARKVNFDSHTNEMTSSEEIGTRPQSIPYIETDTAQLSSITNYST